MESSNRNSGIDIVGEVPWGTHLCMFYRTSKDLAEILVPYFKTGLENNEFCIWVCWEPLLREKAIAEISKEVGDLEAYISKGQIEIVDYIKDYTAQGKTGFNEMVEFWIDKAKLAFDRGFQGLRLAGNTYWLEPEEWENFMRYEAEVDKVIRTHQMIAVCPYSLDKCNTVDVLDVMSSHRFVLIRKEGKWNIIRSHEEEHLQMALGSQLQNFRNSLDESPLGIRIITAEGELLYANQAILDIYGYSSVEELKAVPAKQRYTPQSYAEHQERKRKRKLGQPVPSEYEVSIVRKNGEVRHLSVSRREVIWNGETQFQSLYRDITERKRAEEALKESEEKYRRLIDNLQQGIWLIDKNANTIFANAPMAQILGYSVDEMMGKHLFSFMNESNIKIAKHLLKRRQLGIKEEHEFEFLRKDGTPAYTLLSTSPITDAHGNYVGALAGVQDITERKRAEEQLTKSEESYRELANSITDVFFAMDTELRYTYWNKASEDLMGIPAKDAIGKSLREIFPDIPETGRAERVYREVLRTRQPQSFVNEYPLRDKDFSFEISVYPSRDGIAVFSKDITERKQVEEVLKQSEAHLKEAQRLAKIGSWRWVAETDTSTWSEEYRNIFGWNPKLPPPSYAEMYKLFSTESWARLEHSIRQALEKGTPYEVELEIVRLDGTTGNIVSRGEAIWDNSSHIVGLHGTVQDITARKQAEKAVRESEQKYRTLFDSRVDGTVVVDAETMKIVLANQAAAEMFGFNSVEEGLGVNPLDFIPPEDKERVLKIIAEDMFEKDLRQTNEYRIMTKDDREIWISAVGTRIEHQGKLSGLVSFRDITERKQTEGALRESQERYSRLYEGINEAVALYRLPDLKISHWNKRYEDLHKLVITKDIEGITISDIASVVEADDWDRAMEAVVKTLAGEPVPEIYEIRIKDLEGKRRVIEVRSALYKERDQIVGVQVAMADITERKQAEEALRASEELFRSLFDAMFEGVLLIDATGQILQANPAAKHFLGFQHSELRELSFDTMNVEIIHPDGSPMLPREISGFRVIKEKRPIRTDLTGFKHPDGTISWVIDNAIPLFGSNNELSGVLITFTDITERKRAEEALLESEEELSRILESVGAGITVTDLNGIITDVNEKTLHLGRFGSKSDLFGKSAIETIASRDRERALADMVELLQQGGVETREYTLTRTDGTEYPSEISATVLKNAQGSPIGFVSVIRDITERKRAEEALQESEGKWRSLAKNAPNIISIVNRDGKIQFVNRTMPGINVEELTKRTIYDYIQPEYRKIVKETIKRVFQTGQAGGYEAEGVGPYGRISWYEAQAGPIKHDGQVAAMTLITTDITERKRAEQELEDSRQQLRNLARYVESARERERTRIARELHDEMGQTLTALKMDLSWLNKALPQDQIPLHDKIESMSKLTDDSIGMVKRISTELRPGILDDLGLAAAIEWQTEEFQQRTGIACQLRIEPEDITPDALLSTAIFRIAQEALTNVARHAQATRVKVSLQEKAGKLVLKVRDNGRGITNKKLADPKSLGLVGMRERLLTWHGEVRIRGIEGKGTTVTASVPLNQEGGTP